MRPQSFAGSRPHGSARTMASIVYESLTTVDEASRCRTRPCRTCDRAVPLNRFGYSDVTAQTVGRRSSPPDGAETDAIIAAVRGVPSSGFMLAYSNNTAALR